MSELPELVTERHSWLLERVFEARKVFTKDAATELGVSVDTIRRDLRELHSRGLVRRVHGGAVPATNLPQSFTGRTGVTGTDRSELANAIVERFRAGQVIGLDAGSTNVEVATLIPSTLEITVVTNSPAAAVALADHPAASVILLGGVVDLNWMATVGPDAVDGWRRYRLDVGVVGVCGFEPTAGATTNSYAEVATKRALIGSAKEVLIPVQAEKLRTAAPYVVAEATELDVIIVESLTDPDLVKQITGQGIEVVVSS